MASRELLEHLNSEEPLQHTQHLQGGVLDGEEAGEAGQGCQENGEDSSEGVTGPQGQLGELGQENENGDCYLYILHLDPVWSIER